MRNVFVSGKGRLSKESVKNDRPRPEIGPELGLSGLASTAKVFRTDTGEIKMMKRGDTWMCHPRGTVRRSSINQGWFKSRAVSSRKQEQEVSTLGKAFSFGLICRQRRMRVVLRLTSPLFFASVFAISAIAGEPPRVPHQPLEKKERPAPPARDPRVMEAAKMYEVYFLNQMMKAMRSTVSFSDQSKPSMGESIYREQLDDQYVDSWANQGGIGLAEMIHDDLKGKVTAQREQMARRKLGKQKTTFALTDRDTLSVRRLPQTQVGEERVLVSLEGTKGPRAGATEPEAVRSPWEGEITAIRSADGKTVLTMLIDGQSAKAREVQMAWDGVPVEVAVGDHLRPEQVVGHLHIRARGIVITTRPKVQVQ